MIPQFRDFRLEAMFKDDIREGKRVAVAFTSGTVIYQKGAGGGITETPMPPCPYDCCYDGSADTILPEGVER